MVILSVLSNYVLPNSEQLFLDSKHTITLRIVNEIFYESNEFTFFRLRRPTFSFCESHFRIFDIKYKLKNL